MAAKQSYWRAGSVPAELPFPSQLTPRREVTLVDLASHKKWPSWTHILLLTFLLVALFLRIGIAVRFPSVDYPDETFQTREPAHHLAYGNWVVTWEYRRGVRSWVFPAFLAAIMRTTSWMGDGSTGYLLGISIVLSALSLPMIWAGVLWSYRASGYLAAVLTGCLCVFWYELIYYDPRALSEVVAGHLLLPGLYLGAFDAEVSSERKRRLFLASLLCGLAGALRFQLAPAILLAVVYFCKPNWPERLPVVAAGVCTPILVFGFVDAVTWSYPFQSYFENFRYNFIENQAALVHGVRPWYWYSEYLLLHLGPMLPLAVLGAIWRARFLGCVALAILIPHNLLQHKEFRFLFPLLPIVLTLAGIGLADLVATWNAHLSTRRARTTVVAGAVVFVLTTSASLASVYPRWKKALENCLAFEELSHSPNLCGVAIVGDFYSWSWASYGGYTYLHRKVPMYLVPNKDQIEKLSPSFNTFVISERLSERTGNFVLARCWGLVCLYKRPGTCSPGSAEEINEALRRRNR
jgi:phosphatidylinositol glycan class B